MKALEYRGGCLWLLDQRKLPHEPVLVECQTYQDVAEAIRTLTVRGAPAIGLAAAYASVIAADRLATDGIEGEDFRRRLMAAMDELTTTRPTAVNLAWALRRMRGVMEASPDVRPGDIVRLLRDEAGRMMAEDEAANRAISTNGQEVVADQARVLTHCNTGKLVTSALGTALGIMTTAHEQGKRIHVWVDETRPLLQGSRLTAWELQEAGVPFTLITDSMAGHFMARGQVDLVIVGADRIAANGDTANKIGTYSVAVLAHAHGIPFYVAAPTSTVDLSVLSGADIPIEERRGEEVASIGGVRVAPDNVPVANPAFDVTPARLISGIVTEAGIARPPYEESLRRIMRG